MKKETQEKFKTMIGGQALIEGILMQGPEKKSIVVRGPEGLVVKTEPLKLIKDRYPILGWPLIRGVVNFTASIVGGVKALMYSAEFYPDEENAEPSKFERWLEDKLGSERMEKAVIYFAAVVGHADVPFDCQKPHPAAFLACLDRLGIRSGRFAYIGDHDADVVFGRRAQAALEAQGRRASVFCVTAAWGGVVAPEETGADAVARTPAELAELLLRR